MSLAEDGRPLSLTWHYTPREIMADGVIHGLGVVLGLAGAVAGTRVLRSLLYDVSPTDPLVLALVPLVLLAIAAVASFAPARRAAKVDPVEALRTQ